MKTLGLSGFTVALALAGNVAVAQASDWSYEGSFYLFAAETDVTIGDRKGTLSFSDALDNLDFAAMAAFVATNQQWTFIADLNYFNLGFENDLRGVLFDEADTDQRNTVFTAVALYRVHETPTFLLDLGGGFRYFDTDTTISLRGGLLGPRSLSEDDNWTDAILAAHARFTISDKWSAMLALDYGSFVSDRETYQVTATIDYAITDQWIARAGYRYLNVENDGGSADFRFEQSGPVLGISYRF